jgi:hypothetical protein
MQEEHDRPSSDPRIRRRRSERASATVAIALAGVSLLAFALPGAQASSGQPAASDPAFRTCLQTLGRFK